MVTILYRVLCYLVLSATFLYAVGFVGNLVVPKSIDSGAAESLTKSLFIDLGLLALFATQQNIMRRPGFKRMWTRFVPEPIERSAYVLLTCLVLLLLFRQWRPLPGIVWTVESAEARSILWILFWLGWLTAMFCTLVANHSDVFGLREVYLHLRRKAKKYGADSITRVLSRRAQRLVVPGIIAAFWATPRMTRGHLLFAILTTVSLVVAMRLEESDAWSIHRDEYRAAEQRGGAFARNK